MPLLFVDFVYCEDFSSRLDRWLKRKYEGCTHGVIEKSIRNRLIRVNGMKTTSGVKLVAGDKISVEVRLHERLQELSTNVPLKNVDYSLDDLIIDETPEFLIINKPAGLNVQGGKNVEMNVDEWLKTKSTEYRLVHRIDRATSGLLLIAKTLSSAVYLTKLFRERKIKKTYRAIVFGKMLTTTGDVTLPISDNKKDITTQIDTERGKTAITRYNVLFYNSAENWSDVELTPLTGRKHQLRIHMTAIGHPIVGDEKYDLLKKTFYLLGTTIKKTLFLHSWKISFVQNRMYSWTAALPNYWPR
ncbi:MAG: RluA family pseudouridine synthase [Holosporales bacterium]|jgi:23S rRNA pseudouridine955/2504/2580 synthase|nr:RluA family pseudouridine synthase [Holosporales bacterium]